ncbi:hypothetical protein GQ44DRAFT_819994 [Phaeosphaeriaceae sp. PMI808]|nr:hypothetical protein GQ44DRAFT_819994 [Phaeosphaeriaceae sp. PMI808]
MERKDDSVSPSTSSPIPAPPSRIPSRASLTAHIPKCAICGTLCRQMTSPQRIVHFNRCWKILKDRIYAAKREKREHLRILYTKPRRTPPATSRESPSSSSSSSESESTASIDDDYDFRIPATTLPPTACIFCTKDLRNTSEIKALNHRINCLGLYEPTYCPLCLTSFLRPGKWEISDMAWHIHVCHNDATPSPIDKERFDSLTASWAGQQELVQRLIAKSIGPRKTWGAQEHRQWYQTKRERGMELGNGRFQRDASPLRKTKVVKPGVGVKEPVFEQPLLFEQMNRFLDGASEFELCRLDALFQRTMGGGNGRGRRASTLRAPPGFSYPPKYTVADFDLVLEAPAWPGA